MVFFSSSHAKQPRGFRIGPTSRAEQERRCWKPLNSEIKRSNRIENRQICLLFQQVVSYTWTSLIVRSNTSKCNPNGVSFVLGCFPRSIFDLKNAKVFYFPHLQVTLLTIQLTDLTSLRCMANNPNPWDVMCSTECASEAALR